MKMTPEEYGELARQASPPSPTGKNLAMAFLVGGGICMLGEGLRLCYRALGATEQNAPTLVSVTLVALAVALTGLGVYDKLAKVAGAGTLVPITGFANAVASPSIEFKSEGLVLGMAAKMFLIAGPVLVYGTAASVAYGVLVWLWGLF